MGNAANQQLWQMDDNFDQAMPIDPGVTYFEDGAVYYNPSHQGTDGQTGEVLPCRNDTNSAFEVGILRDLNPVQVYATTQTPNQPSNLARVTRRCMILQYATSGQKYSPFDALYRGTDEQTVTNTGTTKVGYVAPSQSPVSSATSGQQILVMYRSPYPNEDAVS